LTTKDNANPTAFVGLAAISKIEKPPIKING
jgi:hypothetical protein